MTATLALGGPEGAQEGQDGLLRRRHLDWSLTTSLRCRENGAFTQTIGVFLWLLELLFLTTTTKRENVRARKKEINRT